MKKISIHHGRVIDPKGNHDKVADILIENGRISKIAGKIKAEKTSIDASNCIVCPGLVELAAYQCKDNPQTELGKAAAAGITTLCIKAPASADIAARTRSTINQLGLVRAQLIAPMVDEEEKLVQMHAMQQAGCIGVTDCDQPITDTRNLQRAIQYALSFNLKLFFRPAEPFLSKGGVAIEGEIASRLGLPQIPKSAESIAVSRVLALLQDLPASAHFCRISTIRAAKLIAGAKNISSDVGIAYLYHNEQDIDGYNAEYLLSPPLGSKQDQKALQKALARGGINALCADNHFPNSKQQLPFPMSDAGMPTWQMLLPKLLDFAKQNNIPLTTALAKITSEPARILGIEQGTISQGADADLCIIESKKQQVTHTLCNGKIVYQK